MTEQNGQKDWGVPNNLRARQLNMWNGELNALCCVLGSKRNSPSRAAQTCSLSEACHSRDSFQKLHFPNILTFSAAWFTFKRDYNSLHLSRLWSFYSQNHRQSQTKFPSACHAGYGLLLSLPITASNAEGLRRVTHPAGTAFSIQRSDANFFYSGKILTAVGPSDIFNLSGALPEQPQVSTSKKKMWLWSAALAERFLMAMHYATNLSYLAQSVVAQ